MAEEIKASDILKMSVGDVGDYLASQLSNYDMSTKTIEFEGTHIESKRRVKFTFKIEEINE